LLSGDDNNYGAYDDDDDGAYDYDTRYGFGMGIVYYFKPTPGIPGLWIMRGD